MDQEAENLCDICRTIDLDGLFRDVSPKVSGPGIQSLEPLVMVELGTLLEVSARVDCDVCKAVAWLLFRDSRNLIISPGDENPTWAWTCVLRPERANRGGVAGLRIFLRDGRESYSRGRIKIHKSTSMESDGAQERSLTGTVSSENLHSSSQADMNVIRDWLAGCERNHTLCKLDHEHADSRRLHGLLLIDVQQLKLVRADASWRYVALSYVWGKINTLETTVENLPILLREGSLSQHLAQISRIIRDAMDVVNALGERYLWIDKLCIVQDDLPQKATQLNQMDLTYSHAMLTIIALSCASANDPLPGFHPGTRLPTRETAKVRDYILEIDASSSLLAISDFTSYNTRGWTYQEKILSNRRLYFSNWQSFYQCREALYNEDGTRRDVTPISFDETNDKDEDPLLDLHVFTSIVAPGVHPVSWLKAFPRYSALIAAYTERELSWASDKLDAFAGLAAKLQTYCGGGFVCGLPRWIFDLALLWIPSESMVRYSPDAAVGPGLKADFPSWSWAGWRGAVRYGDDTLRSQEIRGGNCFGEDLPIGVWWFKSEISKYAIDDGDQLQTIERQEGTHLGIRFCTREMESSFKDSQWGKSAARRMSLRSFQTKLPEYRLHFWASVLPVQGFSLGTEVDRSMTTILDPEGHHCGVIDGYYPNLSAESLSTSRYQFVLLSRIFTSTETEKLYDDSVYPHRSWCILNVMLIERRRNYAERVAIGRLHAKVWSKVNLNTVSHIVLA